MMYPYQEELIQKDFALILHNRGVGISTLINEKIKTIPDDNRRILIIANDTNSKYFTIKELFQDKVEHKTQSAMKINSNWIHVYRPNQWTNIRGMSITDIFIDDYDLFNSEQKDVLLKNILPYRSKTFWITGTEFNDEFIKNVIRSGHKQYMLGLEHAMRLYQIKRKDITYEELLNDSMQAVLSRIK